MGWSGKADQRRSCEPPKSVQILLSAFWTEATHATPEKVLLAWAFLLMWTSAPRVRHTGIGFTSRKKTNILLLTKQSILDYCSLSVWSPHHVLFHGWKILRPSPHCRFACSGIRRLFGHLWISKMNRVRANARALVVHHPWSAFVPTRPHQNNWCQAVVGELAWVKAKPSYTDCFWPSGRGNWFKPLYGCEICQAS